MSHFPSIPIFPRVILIPSAAAVANIAMSIPRPLMRLIPLVQASVIMKNQCHLLKAAAPVPCIPAFHSSDVTPSPWQLPPRPRTCGGRGVPRLFECMRSTLCQHRAFTAKFVPTPKLWTKRFIIWRNLAVCGTTVTRCFRRAARPLVDDCIFSGLYE